jgi:hypothetical protein
MTAPDSLLGDTMQQLWLEAVWKPRCVKHDFNGEASMLRAHNDTKQSSV